MEQDQVRCNHCGFTGTPESFPPALSVYHDMKCPKCGTTNLDTSKVEFDGYGYGDDNTLNIRKA